MNLKIKIFSMLNGLSKNKQIMIIVNKIIWLNERVSSQCFLIFLILARDSSTSKVTTRTQNNIEVTEGLSIMTKRFPDK